MNRSKVLIISYDWNNTFELNPKEILHKVERDHLSALGSSFFSISWSHKAYHSKINENIETVHLRGFFGRFRPVYDFITPFIVPFILRKHRFVPDIVVVYDFPLIISSLYAKWVWKSSVVVFLTNLPAELARTRRKWGWLRSWYIRIFQKMSVHIADRVYVINDTTWRYAQKLGFSEGRVTTFVPDTIKKDFLHIHSGQPGEIRREYGIPQNKKLILSVGRLEPEKRFEVLIRTFADLNDEELFLIIVGDGKLKVSLQELVNSLNLSDRVIFPGYQPRERIWDFYRDADLFMLCSASEALGLVVWEAMYMSVPVIGSRASGIMESIGEKEERGFLWESPDGIDALRAKLVRALSPEAEEMVKRAKNYVLEKMSK